MSENDYLGEILCDQTLAPDSEEVKSLQAHRKDVEALLRGAFETSHPTIRYGGSYAKGTMIRDEYDLDLISYFPYDDRGSGATLKDVFWNVADVLRLEYHVEEKTSALRLYDPATFALDFHIDVVPGRYTDATKQDTYLYISTGDGERLKTNLNIHLAYVTTSGVIDAIRLLKLWRHRNGLAIRHFALELLTIDQLRGKAARPLSDQFTHVMTQFRDHANDLRIEDPANPTGNDVSALLTESIRCSLQSAGAATLRTIVESGWEAVFGTTKSVARARRIESLNAAAASVKTPTKPWCHRA